MAEIQGTPALAIPSLIAAIVVSLPVLALYRRRVQRSLIAPDTQAPSPPANASAASSVSGQSGDSRIPWPTLADEAVGHRSRLMRLYLVAGIALALVLAVVDTLADLGAHPPSVLQFAVAAVSCTAPLALSIRLVLGRWKPGLPLVAAQLVVLVLLNQLWQESEDSIALALPAAAVLAMLLHPRIRAMGMLAAAFFTIVFMATFVAIVASVVVMQGPIRAEFIADPRTATLLALIQQASSSEAAMWEVYSSSSYQELMWAYWRDHAWFILRQTAILIAVGLLAAIAIGIGTFRLVATRYAHKRISDQWLLVSSAWLYFALAVGSVQSLIGPLGNIACFVVWSAAVHRMLGRVPHYRGPGVRLLLLRSFTLGARSEHLFQQFETMWRSVGSIQLVGATDVALTTLEPHELLDFMRGRSNREFVHDRAGVDARLASFDRERDPDGRFRVNVIYCAGDSTWKYAVHRLLAESDCVLMDLRGFTRHRAGCVFEIRSLAESPVQPRVVFLADQATDRALVRETWMSATTSSESGEPPELSFVIEGPAGEPIGERIIAAFASSGTADRATLPA
ncbi:MAG TPA: hypothetical protein VFS23_22595 [Vicinamibacterales bacterium]|nr:hypothetical protein [Vicinamibacterales bacterium]